MLRLPLFIVPILVLLLPGHRATAAAITEFTVIHVFEDERDRQTGLPFFSGGKLYGVSSQTVFSLNPDGSGFSRLYELQANEGGVLASLVEPVEGTFYGSASYGGSVSRGTIFSINKSTGAFTLLHTPSASEPRNYSGSPLYVNDGKLYLTCSAGTQDEYGGIIRISTDGTGYTLLRDTSAAEGAPVGTLIEGPEGKIFGVTGSGGNYGSGVIFSMNKNGTGFQVLHQQNVIDGAGGNGGLLLGSDGWLYGTGGAGEFNYGTVYRLKTDGSAFEKLHDFDSTDGLLRYGRLIEARDGMLYGTTYSVIFRMNKDGSGYEILFRFKASTGTFPIGGLIETEPGVFYGATTYGQLFNVGTLFQFKVLGESPNPTPPTSGADDDVVPPTLRISNPSKFLSNLKRPVLHVSGIVNDAGGVNRVEYRLNGAGVWRDIKFSQGRWSATVKLPGRRGIHYIVIRAIDESGNFSKAALRRVSVLK